MLKQYLSYLLLIVIAVQSVLVVADVHVEHNNSIEHIQLDAEHHQHHDNKHQTTQHASLTEADVTHQDCQHCCHNHVPHTSVLVNSYTLCLASIYTYQVTSTLNTHAVTVISSLYRPPRV